MSTFNILPREVEVVEIGQRNKLISIDHKSHSYYESENIKYFYIEQLRSFLDGVSNRFHQMIFLMLYETGARINEARNIRFMDIDNTTNKVKVYTSKQRKQKVVYRVLRVSDKLKALFLERRLEKQIDPEDYIMAKKSGGNPISQSAVDATIKRNVERILGGAYLDNAHAHAFRHSRAVHLLDAGMNIKELQRFLGHSNIENTLIYLKYCNKHLQNQITEANTKIGLY